MIKKALLVLALLVAALMVTIALQPADFRVSRSITITAPPAVVFEQVNDLHRWEAWDPWAKLDPNAKSTFDGPPAGAGASLAWAGNSDVGEGRMTITESRPGELVQLRLDFVKPMASTNTAEFTFKPEGEGTVVTWTMYGKKNFVAKAFGLVMDCDKMLGGFFEKGLAQMKAVSEAATKSAPSPALTSA